MNLFGERQLFPKILTVLLSLLCVVACSKTQESSETGERIYARVNDEVLTESELRSFVPEGFFDRLTPTHKKELAKQWVDSEILYQEAINLGIDNESDIARILKKSRRDLLSAEFLARKLAGIATPADEELKKYYNENSDLFILQGDEYVVRYALFDNMNDARSFYNKVKQGDRFSDLAKLLSKDLSSRDGGLLGTVNEEFVEPAVWSEIVNTHERLGLLKISSPFSVVDGFGIIIIDSHYAMGTLKPFSAVLDQVLDLYMIEKREETKSLLLKKLSIESDVEYNF